MLPAFLVAFRWTGSLVVASGCWAMVMKAVDIAVDKAVDSLEENENAQSNTKHV